MAALAFVNMFFRGDGKHNLSFRSCFTREIVASGSTQKFSERNSGSKRPPKKAVTKVLMNPPFSLKDSKEMEPDFIDHALAQLVDGGLLFVILPASVFYEKQHAAWREQLLASNRLLASVSLPIDVFYPVATHSIFAVIKKGLAHQPDHKVLWARIEDDGFVKRKSFRVERPGSSYKLVLFAMAESLREWIAAARKIGERPGHVEFKTCRVDDELIPQAHLGMPELQEDALSGAIQNLIRGMFQQSWDEQSLAARIDA